MVGLNSCLLCWCWLVVPFLGLSGCFSLFLDYLSLWSSFSSISAQIDAVSVRSLQDHLGLLRLGL
ncbi:uncharacterized protein BP01DRAFT_142627 [Aspergillus saccharolyticus JOP 1030-1]|uniref:Uncharacterized protein n=1 Tax=Aspergillus saccharolyticus JOP 1030-1 TaxID=1450539 RepID=A0A318ZEH2_9EURO|nr:hypothetical protein BP01DRAFT_142627 [Aspergillus saccharolyticus JOP 1030-1]PYH41990.1 hypothetical protein BP01DRAFT_142627 [Aspergillus saccharolyticus JOP 1030-1]